jgi:hypothetical protein
MKNPFKRAKQTLSDKQQARDVLAVKLQLAEDSLSGARHDAVQAALAAVGDAEQAAAEDKIHRAETHALTLENALLALDVEIAEAEEAERAAEDKRVRAATSSQLNAFADALEKAIAPVTPDLLELKSAVDAIADIVGPSGLPTLLGNMSIEVPNAVAFFVGELRARAEKTLAGSAPATLPKPFVPTVVPEPPKGPTTQIFALQNLTWRDERGQPQHADAFHIMQLPADRAEIALQRGLAIPPDSERAQGMIRNPAGMPHLYDARRIYDLDRSKHRGGLSRRETCPRRVAREIPKLSRK